MYEGFIVDKYVRKINIVHINLSINVVYFFLFAT